MHMLQVLLVAGLLADIILLLLVVAVGVGLLLQFGMADPDDEPLVCPMCGHASLEARKGAGIRSGMRLLVCKRCGSEVREDVDGKLSPISPS